ncbi:MAG: cytochrome d ubiquinol oxidase subunit II [Ignavibacteria bacterium GWF2_33_9]|nr:MAG: cytochrome d ubiquinol oxidase subunit II [Ignavibacteria bacterium GWF2_33_9]
MDLNIIWFILVTVLLTGYAALDGFDLGVGIASLFTKKSEDKRILMNSIGPLWDGNEVWLITGGGALFAAFPHVYASVFSGLYLALMLVLSVMILRGSSLEFRSKVESQSWMKTWEITFGISSLLFALLLGVALGNVAQGLPVGQDMNIHINLFQLLTPYPILIGLLTIALFTMHGTFFALNKTSDELNANLLGFGKIVYWLFFILFILTTIVTFIFIPDLTANFNAFPLWYVLPVLVLGMALVLPKHLNKGKFKLAFTYSFIMTVLLMTILAVGLFPNFVPSTINPEFSLNLYNAASSSKTLTVMLIIALIGMPIVIAYTIWINKIFRGKTKIEETSY